MTKPSVLFAKNLKKLRKDLGLSQEALAQKLAYSEKAVSKWECGRSMPTADILPQLAEILHVSIDELFSSSREKTYYLGIDGGGTKTDFLLTDDTFTPISRVRLGASNPIDLGMEQALRVLDEGIRTVCKGIPFGCISLFAGLSGGTTGDTKQQLRRFFGTYGFAAFENGSDGQNAVAAAFDREDGICVIIGTGSCAFCQEGGALRRIGGLGYLFDHAGSGYDLGCDALRAALLCEQGIAGPTLLRELVLQRTGKPTVLESLRDFYLAGKHGIAAYSPLVFEAYAAGDRTAEEILDRNMEYIAQLIEAAGKTMSSPAPVTVKLVGGISAREEILPFIRRHIKNKAGYRFLSVHHDNAEGAVLLAGRLCHD